MLAKYQRKTSKHLKNILKEIKRKQIGSQMDTTNLPEYLNNQPSEAIVKKLVN